MSDTQQDSQRKNAIVFIDGVPHFELAADEIVYPIDVTMESGVDAKIFAHLSPYEPRELKAVLERAMFSHKVEGKIREDIPGDLSAYAELARKHYLGLSNVASDDEGAEAPDDVKRQLFESNPVFQRRCALDGYGEITLGRPDEAKASAKFLLLPTRSDVIKVKAWQKFVAPGGSIVRVDFEHEMEKEAKGHRSRYDSAMKSQTNIKTNESRFDIAYDTLEQLYANLMRTVRGYCLNGQLCTPENREEFARLIPLWHKLQIVHHQFDRTTVKN